MNSSSRNAQQCSISYGHAQECLNSWNSEGNEPSVQAQPQLYAWYSDQVTIFYYWPLIHLQCTVLSSLFARRSYGKKALNFMWLNEIFSMAILDLFQVAYYVL